LAGMVGGGAVVAAVPAFTVGWERNIDYWKDAFRELAGLGGDPAVTANVHPIDWNQSVSITSAVHRVAPDLAWPMITLVAATCLVMTWWIYRRHGCSLFAARNAGSPVVVLLVEYAGLIAAILAFSPQTTGRHYNLMLPAVTIFVATAILVDGHARRVILIACAVFGASLVLPPHDLSETLSDDWKYIGGPSWIALATFFVVLNQTLDATAGASAGRDAADSASNNLSTKADRGD
jgi:hypothetical protein